MNYSVADTVFFRIHDSAGEGMFIGHLKADRGAVVLVVGNQTVEMDAEACSPTKRGFPAEGESWRQAHLKENPGTLVQLQGPGPWAIFSRNKFIPAAFAI
jgi:hypothetical protein